MLRPPPFMRALMQEYPGRITFEHGSKHVRVYIDGMPCGITSQGGKDPKPYTARNAVARYRRILKQKD